MGDVIVATMRTYPLDAEIAEMACWAVGRLAKHCKHHTIIKCCDPVSDALDMKPLMRNTCWRACWAIGHLSHWKSKDICDRLAEAGTYRRLLRVMDTFPKDREICVDACWAMANILDHSDILPDEVTIADISIEVTRLLQLYPDDRHMISYGCVVIEALAKFLSSTPSVGTAILHILQRFTQDRVIMQYACR